MTSTAKRPIRRRRQKVSADVLLALLNRLTDRDRAILDLVHEHRVLTTGQIAAIFFHHLRTARERLAELAHLEVLIRFRPPAAIGTSPHHWALGPAGAHVIAAWRGVEVKDLRYRLDKTTAFFLSQNLAHQVGVNDFFARLHACARRQGDGTTLAEWWPERRCARLWGAHAHPDAFGRWIETRDDRSLARLDFFLEHDTGTEPLARVTAKLTGYASLAEATRINTPILFWLPNSTREANLRRLLGTPGVPVATAVHTPAAANPPGTATTPGDGPAGAVWLPAGVTGPRRRLAALADAWDAPDRPRDKLT